MKWTEDTEGWKEKALMRKRRVPRVEGALESTGSPVGVQGGLRGCKDGGQGGGERRRKRGGGGREGERDRASVMIRRCFNDSAFLWQRACRGRPPRRPASVSTRVEGALSGQPPY